MAERPGQIVILPLAHFHGARTRRSLEDRSQWTNMGLSVVVVVVEVVADLGTEVPLGGVRIRQVGGGIGHISQAPGSGADLARADDSLTLAPAEILAV